MVWEIPGHTPPHAHTSPYSLDETLAVHCICVVHTTMRRGYYKINDIIKHRTARLTDSTKYSMSIYTWSTVSTALKLKKKMSPTLIHIG